MSVAVSFLFSDALEKELRDWFAEVQKDLKSGAATYTKYPFEVVEKKYTKSADIAADFARAREELDAAFDYVMRQDKLSLGLLQFIDDGGGAFFEERTGPLFNTEFITSQLHNIQNQLRELDDSVQPLVHDLYPGWGPKWEGAKFTYEKNGPLSAPDDYENKIGKILAGYTYAKKVWQAWSYNGKDSEIKRLINERRQSNTTFLMSRLELAVSDLNATGASYNQINSIIYNFLTRTCRMSSIYADHDDDIYVNFYYEIPKERTPKEVSLREFLSDPDYNDVKPSDIRYIKQVDEYSPSKLISDQSYDTRDPLDSFVSIAKTVPAEELITNGDMRGLFQDHDIIAELPHVRHQGVQLDTLLDLKQFTNSCIEAVTKDWEFLKGESPLNAEALIECTYTFVNDSRFIPKGVSGQISLCEYLWDSSTMRNLNTYRQMKWPELVIRNEKKFGHALTNLNVLTEYKKHWESILSNEKKLRTAHKRITEKTAAILLHCLENRKYSEFYESIEGILSADQNFAYPSLDSNENTGIYGLLAVTSNKLQGKFTSTLFISLLENRAMKVLWEPAATAKSEDGKKLLFNVESTEQAEFMNRHLSYDAKVGHEFRANLLMQGAFDTSVRLIHVPDQFSPYVLKALSKILKDDFSRAVNEPGEQAYKALLETISSFMNIASFQLSFINPGLSILASLLGIGFTAVQMETTERADERAKLWEEIKINLAIEVLTLGVGAAIPPLFRHIRHAGRRLRVLSFSQTLGAIKSNMTRHLGSDFVSPYRKYAQRAVKLSEDFAVEGSERHTALAYKVDLTRPTEAVVYVESESKQITKRRWGIERNKTAADAGEGGRANHRAFYKEFIGDLADQRSKLVDNLENIGKIPTGERVAIIDLREDKLVYAFKSLGGERVAGLANINIDGGSGWKIFKLKDMIRFEGDAAYLKTGGRRVELRVSGWADEFRIEPTLPTPTTKPLSSSQEAEVKAWMNEAKEISVNSKSIGELLERPAEQCELVAIEMQKYMTKKGFEEIKFREIALWENGSAYSYSNHFVVCGEKDGQRYVFDLTAAQFETRTRGVLNGPIIDLEENWLRDYSSAMAGGAGGRGKVVKMRDFSLWGGAKGRSLTPYLNIHPNEYMPGFKFINKPSWYDQLPPIPK